MRCSKKVQHGQQKLDFVVPTLSAPKGLLSAALLLMSKSKTDIQQNEESTLSLPVHAPSNMFFSSQCQSRDGNSQRDPEQDAKAKVHHKKSCKKSVNIKIKLSPSRSNSATNHSSILQLHYLPLFLCSMAPSLTFNTVRPYPTIHHARTKEKEIDRVALITI